MITEVSASELGPRACAAREICTAASDGVPAKGNHAFDGSDTEACELCDRRFGDDKPRPFIFEHLSRLDMEIMPQIRASWAGLGLLLVSLAGCVASASGPAEKLVPVSGTAVFDGKPYERMLVTFIPTGDGNTAHQGSGVTDAEGNFEIKNYQSKKGMPVGTYTVTCSLWLTPSGEVPPADQPPADSRAVQAIPVSWRDAAKAGNHNKVVVSAEGKTDFEFKVPKTGAGPSGKTPPVKFMR